MKFSNWFLNADEKFWSIVKDDLKRKDYLDQLYKSRKINFSSLCISIVILLVYIGIGVDNLSVIGLLFYFICIQGYFYTNNGSEIKIIQLYELLSEKRGIEDTVNS